MKNLQEGETLVKKDDGTLWQFIHHPQSQEYNTVSDDYQYTGLHNPDRSVVHVRRWDETTQDWDMNSHETFSTSDFKKYELPLSEKEKKFFREMSKERNNALITVISIARKNGLSDADFRKLEANQYIQQMTFIKSGYCIADPIVEQLGLPPYR